MASVRVKQPIENIHKHTWKAKNLGSCTAKIKRF